MDKGSGSSASGGELIKEKTEEDEEADTVGIEMAWRVLKDADLCKDEVGVAMGATTASAAVDEEAFALRCFAPPFVVVAAVIFSISMSFVDAFLFSPFCTFSPFSPFVLAETGRRGEIQSERELSALAADVSAVERAGEGVNEVGRARGCRGKIEAINAAAPGDDETDDERAAGNGNLYWDAALPEEEEEGGVPCNTECNITQYCMY